MPENSPAVDGYAREPLHEEWLGAAVVIVCAGGQAVVVTDTTSAWISWPARREDALLLQLSRDAVMRQAGQILDMRLQGSPELPAS